MQRKKAKIFVPYIPHILLSVNVMNGIVCSIGWDLDRRSLKRWSAKCSEYWYSEWLGLVWSKTNHRIFGHCYRMRENHYSRRSTSDWGVVLNQCSTCVDNQSKGQQENNLPFIANFLTEDDKWISCENRIRSWQWLLKSQKGNIPFGPDPKKVLLCTWWNCVGIIHFELLQIHQTIIFIIYCQQLDLLQQALIVKRSSLVNQSEIIVKHCWI